MNYRDGTFIIQFMELVIKKDNCVLYIIPINTGPAPDIPLPCQLLDHGKACFHSVLTYILDSNDQTLTKPQLEQASVLMSHKSMLYLVKTNACTYIINQIRNENNEEICHETSLLSSLALIWHWPMMALTNCWKFVKYIFTCRSSEAVSNSTAS